MKKNIAIFEPNLNIGGIEKSLINLLKRIDYNKYNIDLYLLSKGTLYNELPKEVNAVFLSNPSFYKYLPFFITKKLIKMDKTIKYDAAIDYSAYNNVLSAYALDSNADKKIIWIHNDYKIKKKNEFKFKVLFNLSKSKYKKFDEVVAVSEGVKESFKELTGLTAKNVIPNYIDTDEILKKSKEEVDFHVDDDNINFCFLGRLVYQKGLDLLFPIIKEYKEKNEEFQLYIIGDGPLKDKLINQVEELDLFDNITFLGAKKNPFPYLKKCDYLILNSRYEGQGMVALEAKTLGLKVIMPERLNKYLNIDYIDINDLKSVKKFKKKTDKLEDYNSDITEKIEKLLGE